MNDEYITVLSTMYPFKGTNDNFFFLIDCIGLDHNLKICLMNYANDLYYKLELIRLLANTLKCQLKHLCMILIITARNNQA